MEAAGVSDVSIFFLLFSAYLFMMPFRDRVLGWMDLWPGPLFPDLWSFKASHPDPSHLYTNMTVSVHWDKNKLRGTYEKEELKDAEF